MPTKLSAIMSAQVMGCGCLLLSAVVSANQQETDDSGRPLVEEILVTGGQEDIRTLGGSAQILDEYALEQLDSTDFNQVLGQLPGVYIRQEDGFGLRPNIGLRGATSERSQKITLMEDGVLITPAPYSAPAAYYIPNVNRMSAVEVVKGPSAVRHGPHTVGGAINLATRPISWQQETLADVSLGSWDYQKYRLLHEDFNEAETLGYWIDALRFSSSGYKELDGGGDTGFVRNDFNAKVQWQLSGEYDQLLTAKAGFADEISDETYLGLTDEDFSDNPYRRYVASQDDRFASEHKQLHLEHQIAFDADRKLNTKLYWNQFERSWNKVDGFIDGVGVRDVLSRPEIFTRELQVLRGERNSEVGNAADTIDRTDNYRLYTAYGVQTSFRLAWQTGEIDHQLLTGIRFHQDKVERNHKQAGYLMQDGDLISDGVDYGSKTLNEASTSAWALFIEDEIQWQDWTVTAGVRYENIDGEYTNFLDSSSNDKSQSVVMPGLGVFWQVTEHLGLLAGINKGFSPAAPTASSGVKPEESLNVEYGGRYQDDMLSAEAIGFYSDYDNLLGRCRASDPECSGEEFNGGRVKIAGLEFSSQIEWPLNDQLTLPATLTYTYTESAFQNDFDSDFSQWDAVQKGDELPYTPKHIAYVSAGLSAWEWDARISASYQSAMRDVAGGGSVESGVHTDAYTMVDAHAGWDVNDALRLQVNVDNLTDRQAIVSRRPFGARPNKPRTLRLRALYRF